MTEFWKGTFKSTSYIPGVVYGGILLSKCPEKISATVIFKGFYRQNTTVKLILTQNNNTYSGKSGDQTFTFTVKSQDDQQIQGEYTTVRPNDHGIFSLERQSTEEEFSFTPSYVNQCQLL